MYIDKSDIKHIKSDIEGPTCAATLLFIIESLIDGDELQEQEVKLLKDLATYARIHYYDEDE